MNTITTDVRALNPGDIVTTTAGQFKVNTTFIDPALPEGIITLVMTHIRSGREVTVEVEKAQTYDVERIL